MGGALTAALGASERISNDLPSEGNYCHMKLPAIDESTLASEYPALTDPSAGDIIDFYGSCDHDRRGKDAILAQRWQFYQRQSLD